MCKYNTQHFLYRRRHTLNAQDIIQNIKLSRERFRKVKLRQSHEDLIYYLKYSANYIMTNKISFFKKHLAFSLLRKDQAYRKLQA